MNRPEIYNKTIDILFAAYFNDTLEHGTFCGCAVGNLISANKKYTVRRVGKFLEWFGFSGTKKTPSWQDVILCGYAINTKAQNEINATGYTFEEITKIEHHFEHADFGECEEDFMFNGLVSVLEALKEIHEVTDADLIQANHSKFKAHYNTLCKA